MIGYYMRLALRSFGRNPGLTALMVGAIAFGIAVCVIMLTIYHAMSGNPIWWKSERLYAVTMDSYDPNVPYWKHPQLAPPQLPYKDAVYLAASRIPERSVVMYKSNGVATGGVGEHAPHHVGTRITTADFFAMFDVPFLYGSGWNTDADRRPEPVMVLSREENERMFGGVNSVGRTIRWNDHEFRIVGVLNDWLPQPKFYDLNNGAFDVPEDSYIPFGWGASLQQLTGGDSDCWRREKLDTFQDLLGSDCIWIQMWVELPDSASRERMQTLLDNYWAEQRKAGRYPRPRQNRLTNVGQWLVDQEVVENDNRMLVGMAFAFLAVCLINTIGLLLAKFLNGAAISGVRRALGASRRQIFLQHLIEVGVLSSVGAVVGLGLTVLGLRGVHALYAAGRFGERGGYQELTHFDSVSVIWAIVLAIVAALAAGLYPAWRIGRVPPAVYLKSQ
jgi:putative ABC transport system permease protein